MHYYQFHIGDYASHTRHLSLMEDLAFRRLLDFYYLHEQPIKQRDIARQIGMREHEQDVLTVLNEFFLSTDVGFVNPRADKEIQHFQSKVEQASRAGKASAERRLNARSTDVQPTNNHKPITKNQEPKKKATAVATPDGVSFQTWEDFKTLRKAKKAPITQRAIDGIAAEAEKAGWSLEQALTECVMRGWQAFKADWVNKSLIAPVNKFDVAHITTPTPKNHDAALRKIEEDDKKAAPIPANIREKMAAILGSKA